MVSQLLSGVTSFLQTVAFGRYIQLKRYNTKHYCIIPVSRVTLSAGWLLSVHSIGIAKQCGIVRVAPLSRDAFCRLWPFVGTLY